MDPRPRPAVPRRALLAGALGGVLGGALAGCDGTDSLSEQRAAATSSLPGTRPPSAAVPGPDAAAVARARESAARLADTAERLARTKPADARLLRDVVAGHRAHLAALGAPAPPTTAAPSLSPSRSSSRGRDGELAAAAGAEQAAARVALDDVQRSSPLVAALLARVAAARAVHADLLAAAAGVPSPGGVVPAALEVTAVPAVGAGTAGAAEPTVAPSVAASGASPGLVPLPTATPAPPSVNGTPSGPASGVLPATARDALVASTAGEHAAVFAYGVVVARARGRDRARARTAWAWHVSRRDVLEERLLAAGTQPPAAAPAYALDDVGDGVAAARLAATVERRLTAVAVRAVAATTGDDRRQAAAAAVEASRLTAAWTGRTEPLPG